MKPLHASHRVLYRDIEFNVSSKFIMEVEETNHIVALYPSQIERKCISLRLENKTYFCPLPYRINDD